MKARIRRNFYYQLILKATRESVKAWEKWLCLLWLLQRALYYLFWHLNMDAAWGFRPFIFNIQIALFKKHRNTGLSLCFYIKTDWICSSILWKFQDLKLIRLTFCFFLKLKKDLIGILAGWMFLLSWLYFFIVFCFSFFNYKTDFISISYSVVFNQWSISHLLTFYKRFDLFIQFKDDTGFKPRVLILLLFLEVEKRPDWKFTEENVLVFMTLFFIVLFFFWINFITNIDMVVLLWKHKSVTGIGLSVNY